MLRQWWVVGNQGIVEIVGLVVGGGESESLIQAGNTVEAQVREFLAELKEEDLARSAEFAIGGGQRAPAPRTWSVSSSVIPMQRSTQRDI